jgi:hypothetical protein
MNKLIYKDWDFSDFCDQLSSDSNTYLNYWRVILFFLSKSNVLKVDLISSSVKNSS